MTARRCPTCAAEIGDRAICYRCGALPAVEERLRRSRRELSEFFERKAALLPQRFEAHHFLWACAVIPFFLIPPLISLIYAIRAMRQSATQQVSANFEWIAIVSAINLVVSALVLYKFYFPINEFLLQLPDAVRASLRRLFFFVPQPQQPGPKLTPV
jgi:hypothetical protein